MPAKIVARQIDLICAPKLMSATAALAAPNGGSAGVLPELPVTQCDALD
jgi:hypothetical protein